MCAAAAAVFMFTVMNAFAKYLSSRHSVVEIAFYRNVIAVVPFLTMALLFGRREILVLRSKLFLVSTRAVLGTITLVGTFAAYSLMQMAEASVLMFTASLFMPVLGVLILKEHVGPYRWSAVVAGFLGVAIMLNPGSEVSRLGVAVALGTAFLQAIMAIILRQLGAYERPETIVLYFFLIGIVLTGLAMPFVAVTPTLSEIPLFLGVGVSGAAAQWLISVALRDSPAAIVAVFNYTSIIWATLFGWLVWREWPLPIVFAGAAVVIAANALLAWRESRLQRKTDTQPDT